MRYDYLIVGGGMVADNAARGIRELDKTGSIGILGADSDEPYTRPALSKKLWTDKDFGRDQVPLNTASETGAEIHTTTRVVSVDRAKRTVATDSGDEFEYGELLLATGGSPRQIDLAPSPRVIYFRTFADYRALREQLQTATHIAVVGGGYIGAEIASALVQNGVEVTLVTSDAKVGAHMFPDALATAFDQGFVDHGVTVRRGVKVTSGAEASARVQLQLDDGSALEADAVVFGLGVTPNSDLAEAAGLKTDNGIVVDEFLRTDDEHIHAAGDVANYPDAILGRRRIEHVDNANEMGKAVGRIMAGGTDPYTYTPYFYSDVFDDGYQAVGTVSTSLKTVEDWKTKPSEGIVYYVDESDAVKGVLFWNVWEGLDDGKQLIADASAPPV
ncbi:NAD(P)/FAD-dependent oxidoreductase [Rhodococcus sp. RS1C4]|uniref:NAD(P)/FAD-dependent oxidoreductase n=1 Tax=Nocardiaceae TaxID=85025 RepID=UPI00036461E0|nr:MULTISPECIES: FAD/NAD(P)-binding oxidoreductase [Rhodococcus]OZC48955.1 NAD(P)/FAD-dependent oxidoreductase [Rhodococcus sp. RS1C4]OZC50645.1 NAD(P)/FAD-dependent oxidoreductase [Rhodococcus sp. 06-621-2]OZD09000.1 NAD(P)/FAD-dependent oxidoreductase [Rhodococcus sp. 06-156-4C]OZD12935.1 NAD(P)/FAD-dependent oxidoreductase [Rhodococcus sp. 06-156-3C]OZD27969.1 NAD(P)/FAD-dependent oxidoreductase [Rhodococcus sp. 06-156-4a]